MAEEATDFAPLTFEDWLAKVSKDLRGGDPEKILAYREPDGLGLRALEDEQTAPTDWDPAGFPGRAPYARGTRLPRAQGGAGDWGVGLEIDCASLQKARHFVHHDLQLGASALRLRLADGGIEVRDLGGFAELLEGVDASLIELHLDLGPRPLLAAGLLDAWCRRGDTAPGDLRGSLGVDAMASLAVAGELPDSPAAIYAGLAEAGRWCREQTPGMRAGLLSSAAFHEAGASPVQELAFTLASGVETLRRLDDAGLEPADAAPQLLTAHAVGRDVFLEIAKLRAWRLVWTRVLEALGAADAAGQQRIALVPAQRGLTRVDPWVNMLRAGAQTFVGACAQADIIFAPRFDQLLGEGDEMGRRSAINAQHVLAQEAHLGRVADPAGGSWALEKMTDRLARRAWELFREIEALGGFAQCLRSGEVARRIAEKAERRRADLRGRRQAIVGVSAFPLLGEKRPSFHDAATLEAAGTTETAGPAGTAGPAEEGSALEATEPTVDAVSQALARGAALAALEAELTQRAGGEADVSCPPLEARRDAEEFESVRLTVDARVASGEERPRVLLIALGDRRDFKARLDFAAEFVSVAGFEAETLESIGSLEALDRLGSAWRESSPAAGILCSSDERYGTLAAPAAEALKAAGAERILLAGRPGPLEEAWRRAGIEGFIFLGCDLLEALRPTLEAVLAPPTSTPSSRTVDGGSER